jgi:prophage regulatory protein
MLVGTPQGRVLRPAQAAAKLSIGLSTFWLKVKTDPEFPKPFRLSPRTTVIYEQQLDEYLAACASKSHAA